MTLHKQDCQLWSSRISDSWGGAWYLHSDTDRLSYKERQIEGDLLSLKVIKPFLTRLIPYSAPSLGPKHNLFHSQTALFFSADIRRAAHSVKYFLGK